MWLPLCRLPCGRALPFRISLFHCEAVPPLVQAGRRSLCIKRTHGKAEPFRTEGGAAARASMTEDFDLAVALKVINGSYRFWVRAGGLCLRPQVSLNLTFLKRKKFALCAHCGRDTRGPSNNGFSFAAPVGCLLFAVYCLLSWPHDNPN
jgi:hypothetical protein